MFPQSVIISISNKDHWLFPEFWVNDFLDSFLYFGEWNLFYPLPKSQLLHFCVKTLKLALMIIPIEAEDFPVDIASDRDQAQKRVSDKFFCFWAFCPRRLIQTHTIASSCWYFYEVLYRPHGSAGCPY